MVCEQKMKKFINVTTDAPAMILGLFISLRKHKMVIRPRSTSFVHQTSIQPMKFFGLALFKESDETRIVRLGEIRIQ